MSELEELIKRLCPNGVGYKKLDDVYERIKDLKLNDERLEEKIEKVSEYINREICTQLNNNIISHKEYLNYIESITEEKEEETL